MTKVIKECVSACFKEKIFADIQAKPFSLLIDGSSDLYGDNYLGLLVRYIANQINLSVTKLLFVIELGASATGETLYDKVVEELFDNDFDLKRNFVAIRTDCGSNLISAQGRGLYNRLQKIIPSLIHINGLCHAYHNIAEDGAKFFPRYMIEFTKEVCAYITIASENLTKISEI